MLLKARLLLPDPHRFTIEHVLQVARGTSDPVNLAYGTIPKQNACRALRVQHQACKMLDCKT
jgi:hypothetical protein